MGFNINQMLRSTLARLKKSGVVGGAQPPPFVNTMLA